MVRHSRLHIVGPSHLVVCRTKHSKPRSRCHDIHDLQDPVDPVAVVLIFVGSADNGNGSTQMGYLQGYIAEVVVLELNR
jgi:hypothetical protein